jgi:hypothetical protein
MDTPKGGVLSCPFLDRLDESDKSEPVLSCPPFPLITIIFTGSKVRRQPFKGAIECFSLGIGDFFGVVLCEDISLCELGAHLLNGGTTDRWTATDTDNLSACVERLDDCVAHYAVGA